MTAKKKRFDIRPMKYYVKKHFPPDHPIQVIQHEKDVITSVEEYLGKVEVWLELGEL